MILYPACSPSVFCCGALISHIQSALSPFPYRCGDGIFCVTVVVVAVQENNMLCCVFVMILSILVSLSYFSLGGILYR